MKKFIPVLMAFLFAIAFSCSFALSAAQVNAQDTTPPECTSLEGSNINVNDLLVYSAPVRSYLISTNNQFMRVQGYSDRGDFNVVYYDQDFKTVSRLDIEAELPIFGGFYAFGGNYYIVSGSINEEESDEVEVYRITKYDSDWNRIGSCGLFGANTYGPFEAGSCRITHSGNSLIIRTCHKMYESSDGLRHQANVTIVVDTSNMSITDSAYRVANSKYGYASHSFNQYVKTDGNMIAAVDHGDAHPRAVVLNKFSLDSSSSQGTVNVLSLAGSNNNYTGASVGGLEVSDSSYLIAGNSVVQDSNYNRYKTRNIFVAAVNKSSNDVTVNWLTDLAEGSGTACTPHIVKAGSNQFLVLWYQGDEVKYVLVNGNGAAVSEVYSLEGNLSDCAPILDNGNVVWYTWKDTKETFYKIPVSNPGNAEKHEVVKGHLFELNSVENGLADVTCKRCGYHTTAKVPTSFSVWWSKPSLSSTSFSTSNIPADLEAGGVASYEIDSIGYSAQADLALTVFVLESSDPENCVIDTDNELVTFLKGGNYTITIYPKYNPTKKRTFSVYILMPIESVELTSSTAGPAAPGSQVTLSAAVTGGKGKLEYEYYVIDSDGNETLIQEKSTSKKCYWTPEEPGDYKFRVDVTDPGDNNNKVSSNVINYRVHDYEWQGTEDGIATLKCKTCGDEITGKVPTSFSVYWTETSTGMTSTQLPSGMEPGSEVTYRFPTIGYSAQSDLALNVLDVEASDPDNCIIDTDNRTIRFNKGGNYTITVYPRYNPTLKYNYSVYILKPIDSVELTSSTTEPAAPGSRVTLRTAVDGGKGTLEYEYYVIDSDGNETLIEEKSTRNYCYWTPEEPGEYKFRVDVTDPGDDNNKVSSNAIDYTVHDYEWQKTEDGLATLKCKTCGDEITGKVPTYFDVMWSKPSSSVSSSNIPGGMEPGSVVKYRPAYIRYSEESDLALNDFVFESSDPENCIIDPVQRTVTFNKGGNFTITAYPKYNPSLKQDYTVYILKSIEGVTLTASKTELQQPGSGIMLEAAVDGGKGTLEYEFFVIDSEGNETLIREKGTRDYCYWTPQESGNFKLCADVTDTGDDNNKVRSNLVDFHVHNYEWEKTEDGIATLKCEYCDSEVTGRVPVSFRVWWRDAASGSGYYYPNVPDGLEPGGAAIYMIDNESYVSGSGTVYSGFTMESDDPDSCVISGKRITFNKAGTFKVYVYPTYNPELKKTYTFRIVKTLEGVTLTPEPAEQQEFGRTVKLIAIPDGGRGTVKYTFFQIDKAGNTKTLATDITTPQYTWTAPPAGSYKLKVQAKDTGDDNRTVTSEEVDYTITKAAHPTVMPKQQYTVPFTVSQVSDDIIADAAGWTFDEADLGTELAVGEPAQFTVHYTGADAGNFENLDAVIQVMRAECSHGLTNMVAHPATPFTCEEDGNDPYWQCSLCKKYFSDEDAQNEIPEGSWIIGAHHMLTELAASEPTCEEPGNIHCWKCDVCSKCFEDKDGFVGLTNEEVIVPATGHDWGEWQATEDVSTCVHAGQLMRVCENDPNHVEYKDADLLAHDMIETPVVPATCEEPGNIQYWQCKSCENYFKDAEGVQQIGEADLVIPPLGHDYDRKNGTVTTPATCTEQGEITYTCTHDAGHTITDVLPALGHNWDAGVITTAPTATKTGVKTYTCTRCGGTRTETLPARNNQFAADGTKVGAGASEEVANKAITGMKNDNDPAGSAFGLLKAKSTKQSKTSVTITWSKVKGAKQYVIYGNQCGKSNKMKKMKTLTGSKLTVKKIINNKGKNVIVKKGTYYKFIIVALDGSRNVVSTSKVIHAATKGGKVGNDKSVTTKAKKNKVTVKVGKTFALKAKPVPVSKKLKVKRHRGISYESSDKTIATVSAKGIIKGMKKGTCFVYAYAQDGVCKKITVTVK